MELRFNISTHIDLIAQESLLKFLMQISEAPFGYI